MSKVRSGKKNNIICSGKEGYREKNLGFSPVMKGLSLPINVIVIIAIAILVLVVLAAFFGLNFGLSSQTIAREQALDRACREFRDLNNCGGFDSVRVNYVEPGLTSGECSTTNDLCSLRTLCTRAGFENEVECGKRCGCR